MDAAIGTVFAELPDPPGRIRDRDPVRTVAGHLARDGKRLLEGQLALWRKDLKREGLALGELVGNPHDGPLQVNRVRLYSHT